MKRSEFLGILAGIPFALTGKVKFDGEKTPEEIANHITITMKDEREYRIKPSAFERVGSGYVFEPCNKNEKNQCEWFKHE